MPKIRSLDADGGLQAGERLRESTLRGPMHQDREAEAAPHYDLRPEEISYDASPKNLPDIPARPGYKQRWVHHNNPGDEGVNMFQQRYVQGWRPRPTETIPEFFRIYVSSVKGAAAPENFQIGRNILCEMPEQLHAKRLAYKESQNIRWREVQDTNVSRLNAKGGNVINAINESESRVQTGRRPAVMAG